MATTALREAKTTPNRPIQAAWERLCLTATRTQIAGTTVAANELDADLHVETTTIMFADVVESVRLTEQDEAGSVSRIRSLLKQLALDVTPKFQGTVLERRGDGLLIKFPDVRNAVACAQAAHACAQAANIGESIEQEITLRIGIHSARLLSDDQALYGNGINVAARVTAIASPGETAISAESTDQLVDGLDGELVDLGDCFVRSLAQPLRVFRVGPVVPGAGEKPSGRSVMGAAVPTLAVIPLKQGVASHEHEAVGDLLAESVSSRVSRTQSLRVVSRLSTAAFRNVVSDTTDIARKLGANYLLSGTYSVVRDQVGAYFELADGHAGTILWAERIQSTLADLLAQECELADRVATEVQLRIIDHQLSRVAVQPLPTLHSYSLFLGGLSLMHRQSKADFRRARDVFEYLKDRHPRNAIPRAWLGKWHMLKIVQGWSDAVVDDARIALVEASRALEIEPHNSLCSTVKGVIHAYLQKDFVAADACFKNALLSNPNDALARLQSAALFGWIGNCDLAREQAGEALRLSPLDPHLYFLHSLVAGAFLGAGEHELAEEHAKRSIRANCMHVATYKVLAMAQGMMGQHDEARATVGRLMSLSPDFSMDQFYERSPWAQHPRFGDLSAALTEAGVPKH